MKIKPLPSII
jgi:hypothetical protein